MSAYTTTPARRIRLGRIITQEHCIWGSRGSRGNRGRRGEREIRVMGEIRGKTKTKTMYKAGHEYLLAFKITIPIYDYTAEFCNRWIGKYSRTKDQMEQAARSGSQNIAEGNKQQSLKGYIKLVGVARGSLEELLKDYQAFARQNNLEIWGAERAKGEIREIMEIWEIMRATPVFPDNPNFPHLPDNQTKAVNLLIALISQANYLLDRLAESLKEKHRKEGGFTEKLYRERKEYRGY